MDDFNTIINQLKWKTLNGKADGIKEFSLSCFHYTLKEPFEKDEQYNFLEMLGMLDLQEGESYVKICNYFLAEHIPFKIQYLLCFKVSFLENILSFLMVKDINKQLKAFARIANTLR